MDILLDISWIVIGYVASKEERASESGQEGPNLISYNTVISAAAAFVPAQPWPIYAFLDDFPWLCFYL